MSLLDPFFKNKNIPPIEQLFNLNLLSGSAIFGLRSFVQLYMGGELISATLSFVIASVLFLFYYLSKYKNLFPVLLWPFIFTTQIFIVFLWFSLGGINSPIALIFLVSMVCYVGVDQKKQSWMIGGVVVVFALITLGLEYWHPEWIIIYSSRSARFVDYTILLVCSICVITFILSFMNHRFDEEEKVRKTQNEELKVAQKRLEQKREIWEQLKTLQFKVLLDDNLTKSFKQLLEELLIVSESKCGFIGEVFYDKSVPYMDAHVTIMNTVDSETLCEHEESEQEGAGNPQGLFAEMIKNPKEVIYHNDPSVKIKSFVGLPILHDNKLIGVLGIGDRADGYDEDLVDLIAPFLSTYATIIQNIKLKRGQKKYEKELRIAKDLAEQSSKTKSQFLTNISHELRTPLSLIMGPLAILLRKPKGNLRDTDIRRMLGMMQENSTQMLEFIENILEMSKLNLDQMAVTKVNTNMYEFVETIFSTFKIQTTYRKIKYELEFIADTDLNLYFDSNKIGKIINNLLSNAFKYTKEGGSITFKIKDAGQKIYFEISDSGIGIAKGDLPHIFERFYQTKAKEETIFSGMGVGLAFSQELANLMGFEIKVISVFGKGAVFSFEIPKELAIDQKTVLPIQDASLTKEEEISLNESLMIEQLMCESTGLTHDFDVQGKKNILFMDDSLVMRTLVKGILKNDYNVILAEDGREGLKILETYYESIDMVITDLVMPHIDGFELLETIKNKPWAASIPFIVLSANVQEFNQVQSMNVHVDDYLSKPFDKKELLTCIDEQLKNRKIA